MYTRQELDSSINARVYNATLLKVGDKVRVIATPFAPFGPYRDIIAEAWHKYKYRQASIIALKSEIGYGNRSYITVTLRFDDGDEFDWRGHMVEKVSDNAIT